MRLLHKYVPFTLMVYLTLFSGSIQAAEAIPDISGFWSVSFAQQPEAKILLDKLPTEVQFIDDAGSGELGKGEYSGLALTERALQEITDYDFDSELTIANTCMPPTVAFYMQAPFPMEIFQGRDLIIFKMEYYDMFRVIFMDGRSHPENIPDSKNGHSIGHWEGDELVVDTAYIEPGTFMNNGFNHSSDLHLVERFKLSADRETLWSTEVSEDSAVFEGKAARFVAWNKVANEHVYPYDCDPSFGR